MKIGIDGRLWRQTGVGRYLEELVANLVKIDHENKYILFLRKSHQDLLLPGPTWQKRLADIRWHSLEEQVFMPFILWREHLDLVHFPYFSVPIFYPGKFVVTIHDLILDHFDTGQASTWPWFIYKIKRLGYKLVMWVALHRAVKVIAVSETTKKEIVAHYKINPGKVIVTYEAADNQTNTQGVKSITPLRCKGYFLYVGNAYPHKNLVRLISAFKEVLRFLNDRFKKSTTGWGIKLVLVGSEDYFYKRLKEQVKKMELENSVIFYGEATREELKNLYKNAIALVFPSSMEGFGLPGLEAMANGCPVVCSDIPIFREIYGDAALYFNQTDINNLVTTLRELCYHVSKHSKILDQLKRRGFEQVRKYSWRKLAEETLNIYSSLR